MSRKQMFPELFEEYISHLRHYNGYFTARKRFTIFKLHFGWVFYFI